jgi:uridine kinase
MGPFIIGIAGGTGSGKTTVTKKILERFPPPMITHIAHDSYYKDVTVHGDCDPSSVNFDNPDALETALLIRHLQELRDGKPVCVPQYDFSTHRRTGTSKPVGPSPVILVEGILLFADPLLREYFDLKVFVDTDDDERILRRLQRDISERGRTIQSVVTQYLSTVKPMHELHVAPSKKWADIIIPGGGENEAAIATMISVVQKVLKNDPF